MRPPETLGSSPGSPGTDSSFYDAAVVRRPVRSIVTLAEAQPWHYWIAFVLFFSAMGIVLVALPIGYYLKVWRLKHPKQ
jgi:hypothetical protein